MRHSRFRRGLTIFALVLATLFVIGAGAWTAANIHYGQVLQRELAALKAEGYPLTVAEAQPKPVPADQNAATLYLPLFEVSFDPAQAAQSQNGPKHGLNRFNLPQGFKVDRPYGLAMRPMIESADCQRCWRN